MFFVVKITLKETHKPKKTKPIYVTTLPYLPSSRTRTGPERRELALMPSVDWTTQAQMSREVAWDLMSALGQGEP